MMYLMAAAMFLAAPQEPPKVTYEDSGAFRLLVMDLERRFKGRVRFEPGLASKEVSVSVRDAGYFEVLDALCRSCKEVTYFPAIGDFSSWDHLKMVPGTWVDLPTSYHGHFKTSVVAMTRFIRGTPKGNEAQAQVLLGFFSPPWIPTGHYSCTSVEAVVEEALSPDGRDVRMPVEENREDIYDARLTLNLQGPVHEEPVLLRDLDLSKGLQSLRGSFKVRAAESRVQRMEAVAGSVLETPFARLSVVEVKEFDRSEDIARWKVILSLSPKGPPENRVDNFSQVMERRVAYEGLQGWTLLDLPWQSKSLRIETVQLEKQPRWIEFKIRGPVREYDVPFKFSNVVLKEER